jgi:oligosaccharide repeat unit polymerase
MAVSVQLALDPGILGFLVAGLSTTAGLAIVRSACGPISALSPLAMVAYCQILIFVARPAYSLTYQSSANIFTLNEYDDSMLTAQVYAGVGFIALCIGYSIRRGRTLAHAEPSAIAPFSDDMWRRLAGPLYLIIAAGYGLYSIYILQVGWSGYWSATLSGRSEELRSALSSNSGYFYSGLQFATGALILVIFQNALKRKIWITSALLILLSISMFPQIAAGSRSVFIPVAVAILFILHKVKPSVLKFSRVIIWGPAAFLLGFVAPRIWRDNLAVGGTLLESLQTAMTPENLFDNFFGGLDTAMVDAFALQIAAQQDGELPYQLGRTYAGLFTSIVPRALWVNKPESVDELLNSAIFPETHAKKIGFAFGFYSEPTLNFGFIGVVVVSFFLGWVLASLAKRAEVRGDIASTFVLLMTVSYVFPIMRGSLSFDSQRLLISLLPVLLVFALIRPRDNAAHMGRDAERPKENKHRNLVSVRDR